MNAARALVLALAAALTLTAASCGDDAAASEPTTPATSVVTPQDALVNKVPEFEGKDGLERFTAVATTACQAAVEQGPQLPREGASARLMRRYALDSDPTIHQLDAAIATLVQQRPESAPQLGPLRQALGKVRSTAYVLSQSFTRDHNDGTELRAALADLTRVAQQVELPACTLR